ncbi:LacI family transcriptional regulator (plasmid) [Sphingomonas sp. NY01]|uniref:LacI family DNA-binding transcriptional regulator n=1 Tax=Sphingomonas sp. NY01 TaxID=2968057 RepID=UPI00315CE6CA
MTVGIKQVAKAAGVSIATVSRVLSGRSVRAESRRRVEAALARLDYLPNLLARRLRAHDPSLIGVIVPDIGTAFFRDVVRALEVHARRQGLRLILCSSDEDAGRQADHLTMLHEERVSGIIMAPVLGTACPPVMMPIVLFDRHEGDAAHDLVVLDNEGGAAALVGALHDGGCQRFLGLFGTGGSTARERERGFAQALAARGLTGEAVRVADAAAVAQAVAAAQVDAVLCGDGCILLDAAVTIRAAHGPDPQLAGFDRVEWAGLLDADMTVLTQPVDEIAHAALALLVGRMAGNDADPIMLRFSGCLAKLPLHR